MPSNLTITLILLGIGVMIFIWIIIQANKEAKAGGFYKEWK
jgi:hypothetical protein